VHREVSVASVARPTRHVLTVFVLIWFAMQSIKLCIAATLAPFGDEAFYWQESRALAWSFTDVPPATALMIRAGETVFGHSLLGMRSLFLLLGAALPLWLWQVARRESDACAASWIAIGWLLLPLGGTLGVMAMPDVPLTAAALAMLAGLLRIARAEPHGNALLGAGLALAWLSHYRAAMLLPGGLGLLLFARGTRGWWTRRGFWFALGAGSLGLLPLVLFNRSHDWSGLSFQLVERHPWRFHADGFVQPLEQALVVTPLLYGLLLWALWRSWRARGVSLTAAVLAWSGLSVAIGYFAFGLFGDDLRFRVHWPLPAYLAALIALARLLAEGAGSRRFLVGSYALAALGCAGALGYLAAAADPVSAQRLATYKAFPYNFVGWNEVAARTGDWIARERERAPVLVADNFLLGAELDFQFDAAHLLYSLDHPRNVKHGRAPQLALWQRDERGLRARHAGRNLLLVVERTTGSERERAAWQQSLCRRVADLQMLDELSLFGGRKVFAWYRGRVPEPGATPDCASAVP
jgi:4-amino-4-deoxy-L-arabinose transferase-like glycosyltransferase